MAKKPAPEADHVPDAGNMPDWFDSARHRIEPRGIVLAATGDLLAEDGRPVNAAARAALATVETPLAPPAAEQE